MKGSQMSQIVQNSQEKVRKGVLYGKTSTFYIPLNVFAEGLAHRHLLPVMQKHLQFAAP